MKKSHKVIVLHKLDARLTQFLHIKGIDVPPHQAYALSSETLGRNHPLEWRVFYVMYIITDIHINIQDLCPSSGQVSLSSSDSIVHTPVPNLGTVGLLDLSVPLTSVSSPPLPNTQNVFSVEQYENDLNTIDLAQAGKEGSNRECDQTGEDTSGNGSAGVPVIHLSELQTIQAFIDMLQVAALKGSGMTDEDIALLYNPGMEQGLVDLSPLLQCICHFVNNALCSHEHYEILWQIELLHNPDKTFFSFDQVKWHVKWLSGVIPIEYDICVALCMAYTGPHSDLDECLYCTEPCYICNTMTVQRHFLTISIGPVIQAFYSLSNTAQQMHYLKNALTENVAKRHTVGVLET
jgi:hypothetical protein